VSSTRRSWWAIYTLCAALALGALGWVTAMVLDLEQSQHVARVEAERGADLRLALRRVDSWFGSHLQREASRPFFHYFAYYPQEQAYTRILRQLEPGEVLVPSPLLAFEPGLIVLHFQVDETGVWSSPQVPTGNWLDITQESLHDPQRIEGFRATLEELARRTSAEELCRRVEQGEAAMTAFLGSSALTALEKLADADEATRNRQALARRAQEAAELQSYDSQVPNSAWTAPAPGVSVGPLVPVMLAGTATDSSTLLSFVRKVRGSRKQLLQGFVVDWERLEGTLLAQVSDLFSTARLHPDAEREAADDPSGAVLTTVPAFLEVSFPGTPPLAPSTPVRVTLGVSWLAALLALVAVGITLRASIAFGERRSRFASAVTHELRTPLTTFRMYSEMLAKDMVPEERRKEYLDTLQGEARRLSGLVENVLAYARLEEGRLQVRRERVTLGELLERCVPDLERRASEADMVLRRSGEADPGALGFAVETDVDAVRQILFNLVDNACKYGRSERGGAVQLGVAVRGERIQVRVRDHGAGVPPGVIEAIFRPFDRGKRDASDRSPGVGLGLALARGLARDLGGELTLESVRGSGASFLLELPRV